jgi:hypothetical protein
MPKLLRCDNVKNGIELISSIERIVIRFEKKSGAIGSGNPPNTN